MRCHSFPSHSFRSLIGCDTRASCWERRSAAGVFAGLSLRQVSAPVQTLAPPAGRQGTRGGLRTFAARFSLLGEDWGRSKAQVSGAHKGASCSPAAGNEHLIRC